jgi:CIC family chloride channel protein
VKEDAPRRGPIERLRHSFQDPGFASLWRWGWIGVGVGIGAALGALALLFSIRFLQSYLFGDVLGYAGPAPLGEGGSAAFRFHMARPLLLPILTMVVGLVGGLIVWLLAPETAGIGTNAAIAAFHQGRPVKIRAALVKIITSALTIGGGLTSGREGPIAQIGAGAGSSIAEFFKLSTRERNIALAAGLGAGIAAIFRAPFAGAIIGAEIFYMEDFEVEALIPGIVASVVGYAIVGYVVGFQPIFTLPAGANTFAQPVSLLLFALLGVLCALFARLAIAIFFPIERAFGRFPLPAATALGGLLSGLVGLGMVVAFGAPTVLGTGYGYVQLAVIRNGVGFTPLLLIVAAFAEVVCAALTLGSGNSGGIFGPSIVTGGFVGAFFGVLAHAAVPSIAPDPAAFAVVGMVAFFAAAAKAPISTIVMIAEMTGGYGLLAPAMFAVVVAFFLSGHRTIFPAQVRSRLDSPFHADEFEPLVLRRTRVREVMRERPLAIDPDMDVETALSVIAKADVPGLPVVERELLVGLATRRDLLLIREGRRATTHVGGAMRAPPPSVERDDDLFVALDRMLLEDVRVLPVVERDGAGPRLVGLLSQSEIGQTIQRARAARNAVVPPLPRKDWSLFRRRSPDGA